MLNTSYQHDITNLSCNDSNISYTSDTKPTTFDISLPTSVVEKDIQHVTTSQCDGTISVRVATLDKVRLDNSTE